MSRLAGREVPLLLGPGVRQRARKRREGEIGRRSAVEESRHDPGGKEGQRCEQPDVPHCLAFATGDHRTLFKIPDGSLRNPVEHQFDVAPDDRRFLFLRAVHVNDP